MKRKAQSSGGDTKKAKLTKAARKAARNANRLAVKKVVSMLTSEREDLTISKFCNMTDNDLVKLAKDEGTPTTQRGDNFRTSVVKAMPANLKSELDAAKVGRKRAKLTDGARNANRLAVEKVVSMLKSGARPFSKFSTQSWQAWR